VLVDKNEVLEKLKEPLKKIDKCISQN